MNKNIHRHHVVLIICLLLTITTLAVFWQVQNFEFVNFDDDLFILENHHVQDGLSLKGVVWAFTTTHPDYWHPLPWLSHMLDWHLYGRNPKGHHFNNLLIHLANTLLLFLVLGRMTNAIWRSAFVAALFAFHPLHVEPVAWVTARKDILSTFFWVLTLWGYTLYVERPRPIRYLLLLLSFTLGLMSKPMLVTLPFLLLLLDYWPLRRFQFSPRGPDEHPRRKKWSEKGYPGQSSLGLIYEKLPLFALAGISICLTVYWGDNNISTDHKTIGLRVANTLISYVIYIKKTVLPYKLAVFYPYPVVIPVWQAVGACLVLIGASALILRSAARHPYLIVGWLWYLGILLPVSGLIQLSGYWPAMADKYTYVPLIGLFIIIAWGIPDIVPGRSYQRIVIILSAFLVISSFMIFSWWQVRHWRNSIALFGHALNATSDNYLAHNNLGHALAQKGELKDAIPHFTAALRIKPNDVNLHNNIGAVLARQGRLKEAVPHFLKALEIAPDSIIANYNLGRALLSKGKFEDAIKRFSRAIGVKPDYAEAHYHLGIALAQQGKMDNAIAHFTEALRIKPDYPEAHNNLGVVLYRKEELLEALSHFSRALQIRPAYKDASRNLRITSERLGKTGSSQKMMTSP